MTPCLNWRELQILVEKIRPQIEGSFVDRLIVAERPDFPEGYIKGEWVIRLTGRKTEGTLLVSIRPRHPYLSWQSGKGPKASTQATRSPFDLAVTKHLKGSRLTQIQTLPKERVVILWFSGQENYGLVLVFIPSAPEAFLVKNENHASDLQTGWPILARSRTVRNESQSLTHYFPPDGLKAPADPAVRYEILNDPSAFHSLIESELKNEAFELRVLAAEKGLRQLLKQAQERHRQSKTSLDEAKREPHWQKYGDLLKNSLGMIQDHEVAHKTSLEVKDYETEQKITLPKDPSLTLQQQTEKFFQNAKRNQRRIHEAKSRMERFSEYIQKLEKALLNKPAPLDWGALSQWEKLGGISLQKTERKKDSKSSTGAWLGKTFTSKDGSLILVGRSKDENLELTFKRARGNDIWMHIRGRPGAHILIPLQAGKSASLDTLLDAAHLAIHYSGGSNWGKTEVDYTFKKYVKRIRDSTEASYTHNKTLLVEPDPVRKKRLLDQD